MVKGEENGLGWLERKQWLDRVCEGSNGLVTVVGEQTIMVWSGWWGWSGEQ